MEGIRKEREIWEEGEAEKRRSGGDGGNWPPSQTPLKQKHPFSSKNKPPSQDLHEWSTSASGGSSNVGAGCSPQDTLEADGGPD